MAKYSWASPEAGVVARINKIRWAIYDLGIKTGIGVTGVWLATKRDTFYVGGDLVAAMQIVGASPASPGNVNWWWR